MPEPWSKGFKGWKELTYWTTGRLKTTSCGVPALTSSGKFALSGSLVVYVAVVEPLTSEKLAPRLYMLPNGYPMETGAKLKTSVTAAPPCTVRLLVLPLPPPLKKTPPDGANRPPDGLFTVIVLLPVPPLNVKLEALVKRMAGPPLRL